MRLVNCYALPLFFQIVVNGFEGVEYSTVQAERNAIFKPKVSAVIQLVLNRGVGYSVVGRAGEVRRGILPPVEVIFESTDIAEEFRREGTQKAKMKKEGVSHLYFNSCLTLSTR